MTASLTQSHFKTPFPIYKDGYGPTKQPQATIFTIKGDVETNITVSCLNSEKDEVLFWTWNNWGPKQSTKTVKLKPKINRIDNIEETTSLDKLLKIRNKEDQQNFRLLIGSGMGLVKFATAKTKTKKPKALKFESQSIHPLLCVSQDKPSEYVLKKVFETFGEVRCVDIPMLDPYR